MTNYGQQRISIDSQTVGSVRITSLTHAPALAPRLCFHTAWTLTPYRPRPQPGDPRVDFRVTAIEGELRTGESGPAVGLLFQLGERQSLRSLDYADEQHSELIVDLDWFRFERLEELRQGGPLQVWIKLWPRAEAPGQLMDMRVDAFTVRIPREDWLAVISGISGDRTDLLEVRYHLSYAGRFRPSLNELAHARRAIDRGETTKAVLAARKAITLVEQALRAGEPGGLEQLLAPNVDPQHAKIYAGIASHIKNMGNIQAHEANAREHSRAEALFAVRSTELLLELIGSLSPK